MMKVGKEDSAMGPGVIRLHAGTRRKKERGGHTFQPMAVITAKTKIRPAPDAIAGKTPEGGKGHVVRSI